MYANMIDNRQCLTKKKKNLPFYEVSCSNHKKPTEITTEPNELTKLFALLIMTMLDNVNSTPRLIPQIYAKD
jgi:hypothetical protein